MKYIIELEDEPNENYFGEGNFYRCKQIPYWSMSESMKNRLEPYNDADRPKGEWEEMRNWRNGSFYSRCSECGYFDDERDDLTAYNFCPQCGAKMKGVDDD